MTTRTSTAGREAPVQPGPRLSRIAVGVNGFREGQDAAQLGAALATATNAELTLIAIQPEPLVVLPPGLDWNSLREDAEAHLRQMRGSLGPQVRTMIETDLSVPRALHRLTQRHHHDLLVLGSSRHAPAGRIRIGKRTRQLIGECECPLAIAPRGLGERPGPTFNRIGVGYDDGAEAKVALAFAASIAAQTQARLHVYAVLDDRMPAVPWAPLARMDGGVLWELAVEQDMETLGQAADAAVRLMDGRADTHVYRGRPSQVLIELCRDLDLLVIGSRRWGAFSRLLAGSTGEALLHDAPCPVVIVPRPAG